MASSAAIIHNPLHSPQPTENASGSANLKQPTKRKIDNDHESEKRDSIPNSVGRVLVQLRSESGVALDAPLDLELAVTPDKLHTLVHALLKQVHFSFIPLRRSILLFYFCLQDDVEHVPYTFYATNGDSSGEARVQVSQSLGEALKELAGSASSWSSERLVDVMCVPQALFRVLPVARCSATIDGHTEAVISLQFSPDGTYESSPLSKI